MQWWQLFLLNVIFTVNAEIRPGLEIQPNNGIVSTQVGASLALTCKPNVQDPSLITQLEWRDSRNRRIENKNRATPLYVQNISGEPGLVLIFSSLMENQAGNYTCAANYANTEQIKAIATVNTFGIGHHSLTDKRMQYDGGPMFKFDIKFIDAPESQYPKVGEDFKIKCKVEANPIPIVDWNKNDVSIVSGDRYVIENDGLLIKNVREADDGVYKCTALVLSTGQIKTKNIKVEVLVPPFIEPMKEVSVIEGETASTKCVATGKPPPTYMWIKENTRQDLSKTDRFDVKKNTGDLIINRVEFNDNSIYKCIAENRAGHAETVVKINVLVKPRIYELINVTAPTTTETKIVCKAQGRPTPAVIFRKLSSKEPFRPGQQFDKRIILEQQFFEDKGESYGTLIISDLNRTDDGLYECIAQNSAGTAYKNGHITVEFKPTFERTKNFSAAAWSWHERPGNLTCLPEAIPNATIIWKYSGREIVDNSNFRVIGHGPVSHLIVKPLHDARFFTNYECVATNKHGSESILIQLKEARVPGHVTQVKIQSFTATTIRFSIQPPSYFDSLPIRSFTVQFKREQELSWDYARNHTWSFNAPYILENLIPEKTYHFRFAASNDVGIGPFTNAETFSMPRRSEPAEPKIFTPSHVLDDNSSNRQDIIVVSPYADHFELRWKIPNDNGDPIDGYLIRYCVTEKINGQWRDSDCSEEIRQSVQYTSYELNTLRADTTYKIELRAHNAIGSSLPAQIRVRTARGMDPAVPYNEPSISSSAIIGIVVAAVFLFLLLVDVTCYCTNDTGILAFFCNRNRVKKEEDDAKLGSLYSWRFPLPYCSYKAAPAHPNSLNLPLPVKLATSPMDERQPLRPEMNGEKPMSVEFDGRHVYSKQGEIIGKHSAV